MTFKKYMDYEFKTSFYGALDSCAKHLTSQNMSIKSDKRRYNYVSKHIKNYAKSDIHIDFFYTRVTRHINTVKNLGNLFDLDFENHDICNFYDFDLYSYFSLSQKTKSYSLKEYYKQAQQRHFKTNKHHPEYWSMVSFMPPKYIIEMVCDWHATSVEGKILRLPNIADTRKYYTEKALQKYKFTESQKKLIISTIETLETKSNMNELLKIWQR